MPLPLPFHSRAMPFSPGRSCFYLLVVAAWSFSWVPVQAEGNAPRAEGVVTISLHEKAVVRGWEFRIGEIADVTPAESDLARQVKKVVIARSPWPGYTRHVSRDIVRMALRDRVSDPSRVEMAGATSCSVNTAAVKVPGELFIAGARKHILRHLPWPSEDVEISCTESIQDRYVPIGMGTGPVLEVTDVSRQRNRGLLRLKLRVLVDGRPVFHVISGFQVRTFQDIVVAAADLPRGKIVGPEDVTLARREVRDLSFSFFTEMKKVIGKRVVKRVREGAALSGTLLEDPPVIFPKALVNIVYKSSSLKITVPGMAEEEGAPGQVIRVRSLAARKQQLYAQVIDSRTVFVTGK